MSVAKEQKGIHAEGRRASAAGDAKRTGPVAVGSATLKTVVAQGER